MYEFFHKYFVLPILNFSGYNFVNTFVYAIILIFAIYFVFKLLKILKIKIDEKFALSLLPWILLGSILRVIEDSSLDLIYFLISPIIYLTIFLIAFSFLLFSLFLEKRTKITWQIYFFSFGFILSGIFFTQIHFVNFFGATQILTLDLIIFILVFYLGSFLRLTKNLWNKFTIFSQLYDASSTFISLQFWGYREQHILPNLLLSIFGNWSFFIFKFLIVVLFIYVVDSNIKNKEFRNWLKLIVILLGVAQGTRDLLRLFALV
ncbi:MAG TPA: DUF63 family protein [Candidatus Aenigmarchaeota archaeon]|nr:DUF63 family protein [Candidatus Aenigmarchaeota archaeon]